MLQPKNIYIRIHGGLGNQLFQYSYLLYLRKFFPDSCISFVKLHYKNEIERPLSILNFDVSCFVLSQSKFNRFNNSKINKIYNLFFICKGYILEGFTKLTDDYLPKHTSINEFYFDGYWQKLFIVSEVENCLRKKLIFNRDLSFKIKTIENKIKSHDCSVSLHVRRTDFFSSKKNKSIFAECSINYYYEAIKFVSNNVCQDLVIFIFSDDFDWVKSNFDLNFNFVLVEGNLDFEDLYLMSICKHNITANSTFSWWGAWLNGNNNKVVITPEKWFSNGNSTDGFLPNDWIKVPN